MQPRPVFAEVTAIFFDLDDTLCGYWEASKKGLREALDQHPIAGFSTEAAASAWAGAFRKFSPSLKSQSELYQQYLTSGEPTRTLQMKLMLKELGIEDDAHAERLSEAYMRRRDANLALFSDALTVLEALRPHYPIGLITNGPADIQNQEIDTLGIRPYFDPILIEGEMGIGKPEREVFERAEKAVGAPPEQILMVGNSLGHDIKPAIRDGWKTAWTRRDTDVAPSSRTGLPEPVPTEGPLPTLIVGSLSELLPALGR